MALSEIDSFVEKFKHLWHAGIKASLNVESFDGEACVTLQAGLGNIPPPYQFPSYHPRPPRGPAYERRQEKRKAARQAPAAVRESLPEASGPQSENIKSTVEADGASKISDNTTADQAARSTAVMNENDAVKADDNFYCQLCDFKSKWENGLNIHMKRKHSIIEQIDGNVSVSEDATNHDDKYSNTIEVDATEIVAEFGDTEILAQVDVTENVKENDDNTEHVDKITENSEFVSDTLGDTTETVVQVERDAIEENIKSNHVEVAENPSVEIDKVLMEIKIEVPEESIIHAEVSFDNSPNASLSQADLKFLEEIIFRLNHMRNNICRLDYGEYFTSKLRNQKFKHKLEIKLMVKTKNLWENARSYIWKHFGQHEWQHKDGTKLTMNRIHMKGY